MKRNYPERKKLKFVIHRMRDHFTITAEVKRKFGLPPSIYGNIEVWRHGNKMQVTSINVDSDFRRRGLATALYEHALRVARKTYKKPLASDYTLSDEAQSFWEKQQMKGRANEEWDDEGSYYVIDRHQRSLAGFTLDYMKRRAR